MRPGFAENIFLLCKAYSTPPHEPSSIILCRIIEDSQHPFQHFSQTDTCFYMGYKDVMYIVVDRWKVEIKTKYGTNQREKKVKN